MTDQLNNVDKKIKELSSKYDPIEIEYLTEFPIEIIEKKIRKKALKKDWQNQDIELFVRLVEDEPEKVVGKLIRFKLWDNS